MFTLLLRDACFQVRNFSKNGSTTKYIGCFINIVLIAHFLIFYNIYSFVNDHGGFKTVRDNLATIHYKIFVA